MKKLIYLSVLALMLPLIIGCDDFLDTTNYRTKDENSFPKSEKDAQQMLVGVYSILNVSHAQAINTYLLVSELVSDDRFGGGGENDKSFHAISHLMYSNVNQYTTFWRDRYRGISRSIEAEAALAPMEEGPVKNQKLGEVKFLRAHFYFELAQMFGNIPLITALPKDVSETEETPPQVPAEEVFQAIATDLWEAYNLMPEVRFGTASMPISGTVTKWAAAGLLARVYLFYTGFYGKTSMPIEGGEITNAQVVAALENVMSNSGHALMPDFRSLWPYTNSATKPDYEFAKDAPTWQEGSKNSEVIFAIKMNGLGDWGTTVGYSNSNALFFAIRNETTDYRKLFPIGQGWGAGPVSVKLWEEWPANDPRRMGSIYNQSLEATDYKWGSDSQMEETGMWQKKIVATTAYGNASTSSGLFNSFCTHPDYGMRTGSDMQLEHGSDLIMIRYADVLLMHSELTKTVTGINQVRARASASAAVNANLAPIGAYSDQALRNERRWELAFEGLRWGDIRRWGIAGQSLEQLYGQPIRNRGREVTSKAQGGGGLNARYNATKGFFNKPEEEINLANGALTQNPGWGSDASFIAIQD